MSQITGLYRDIVSGKSYFVFATARHTETGEDLVAYKDEYEQYYVQPKKIFNEDICYNGKWSKRFELFKIVREGHISFKDMMAD
jgi:hypothetical protein